MKKKTEEEKVGEYVNFFNVFCRELTRRNEDYSFSLKTEKMENRYTHEARYTSFISVSRKCGGLAENRMRPTYEVYFNENPKKTKLNSLRSLFRKTFSGISLLAYFYSVTKDSHICEDLVDNVSERHNVVVRFEKYKGNYIHDFC